MRRRRARRCASGRGGAKSYSVESVRARESKFASCSTNPAFPCDWFAVRVLGLDPPYERQNGRRVAHTPISLRIRPNMSGMLRAVARNAARGVRGSARAAGGWRTVPRGIFRRRGAGEGHVNGRLFNETPPAGPATQVGGLGGALVLHPRVRGGHPVLRPQRQAGDQHDRVGQAGG